MSSSVNDTALRSPMASDIKPPQRAAGPTRPKSDDAELRRHLTYLAKVAQFTSSALVITDAMGVTSWVNEAFTRITGYGFDEVVGRKPGELLQGPETDRDEVARIRAALRSGQRVAAELINYAKDGRRYWVGMKIEPMRTDDGELEGFMAIQADITSRQEERLSIERLTQRFNLATRAARVGIFERDATGEIIWWNEIMFDIFGVNPATFNPCIQSWMALIHPEDRDRMRQRLAGLSKKPASYNWIYRIVRPDGVIRHIRSIGAPSESRERAVTCITGITLDISERVEAQEREQAMQQQLIESSHQAGMAEIATGVLHNVGNILNSLGIANSTASRALKALRVEQLDQSTRLLQENRATLADFLTQDERGRHLPEYLQALADQISSNCRAVQAELDTTDQLLRHLSNVVSAQQEMAQFGGRRESIRLQELLESAVLVQASELAQVEIVREYEQVPEIMSDRHKLLQILVNLISNARDALHSSANERRRIVLKIGRAGDHVRVTVEDSGIGMTAEVLSKLWKFGFTTKKNGHGFGLHNSANAAHQIGATLTAHSDGLGLGSRFILSLPIDNPETMLSGEAA
jgi:PAS domain S-box-containing protein